MLQISIWADRLMFCNIIVVINIIVIIILF